MGLAYDLDTKSFPNPHFFAWDEVLRVGDEALFIDKTGRRGDDIDIPSPLDANYSEFDVIIRSTTYSNDFYIITGSYRAFFKELNGGAGAWAWDGFITFVRAHNIGMVSDVDIPVPPPESFANDPRKFWIRPGWIDGYYVPQPFSSTRNAFFTYLCRMPYEVEPDLTGLGSDSTPGVYAVDVAKFGQAGQQRIVIYAGGHQRIASTEGMTTSQNYSGWISKLHFSLQQLFIISTQASVPGGKETSEKYRGLSFETPESFTASWKGDTANHVGRYLPSQDLYPNDNKNLEDVARGINTTTNPYGSFNFDKLTAIDNGYYISRIHDLVVTNGGPFPLIFADTSNSGDFTTMCMSITGEAIADDGAGAVSFTTPFVSFWQPDENNPFLELDQCYTSLGNKNWGLDGSLPSYNLNGAYGTVIMPTYTESPDPFLVNVSIGIDNVTHGATTSAEIYVANWQYCLGCFDNNAPNFKPSKSETVFPFAVKGGGFETATGYTLPDKWLGKAVQQATYSRQDEANSKLLEAYEFQLADPNRGTEPFLVYESYADRELELLLQSDPTLGNLQPDPLNFLVPFNAPNYYQYGTSNKGEPPVGFPANVAYGFLGYSTGVGPVIFMYDFGTLYMTINNTNPPKYLLGPADDSLLDFPVLMISVGDTLNGAIEGGSSTTRRPVSARWDADRDQWIFTFADTTGGSLVSCNSAFDRQPPTQIAYLDQTDQFIGIDSDAKSSLYISRNMTPFLDGLVLFGGEVDTASKGQTAIKAITINAQFGGGAATPVTGFQPYIIQGTTGREARVWVDYLLFDGVDSMVATELQSLGLRVTVENVEWYKAKIIKDGKTGITPEEIEDWVRSQQTEYRETLKLKERQGRLRTRRRQQAAWREGLEDTISGEFQETTGFDSLESLDKAAETFVPSASESAPISGNKSKKHSSIQKSKADKKRD